MSTKKYELLDEMTATGTYRHKSIVHPIRALRDIPRYGVKKGDIGGCISSEDNLSQPPTNTIPMPKPL